MRQFFSAKNVFTTRSLAVMSLMLVLTIVLTPFSIQLTPTFRIFSVNYLPGVAVATLFGPWAAIVYGFAADTVSFLVSPNGAYLPLYAFSAALTYFIYACLLYRKPNKIWRILVARILYIGIINFGLHYLFNVLYFGSAASAYFTTVRLISNLINLPVSVVLIYFFNKLCAELYARVILRQKPLL